jgi:hypothetical protein
MFLSLLSVTVLLMAMPLLAAPQQIKLAWDWDANGQNLAECSFRIYQTTNVSAPLTNWVMVTNVTGTNAFTGSNYMVPLMVVPAQYFWTVTVSNFWSESDTSNVVNAPPVPLSPKLKLSK